MAGATRSVLARLAQGLVVVALVASTVFVLVRLAPGDPFATALDDPMLDPAVRARWRAAYGLDGPIGAQFARWLGAVATGDLGWSTSRHAPVTAVIADALPWTLALSGSAMVLAFAIGMPVGAWQARRRGTLADRATTVVSVTTSALPDFWFALAMLLVFALGLRLVPVGGATDPLLPLDASPLARAVDLLRHLALPLATTTVLLVGVVARLQRTAVLDRSGAEWVRTAQAKGVAPDQVFRRHVWRTALGPMVTLGGLALPGILGAGVFIEHVFAWPGFGALAAAAIASRDHHLVVGCALTATVFVVVGSWLADVVGALLDPRLREPAGDAVARR